MLYFEWKEEDAIKYAKEEGFEDGMSVGKAEERKEMIRAFKDVLSPEVIAEKIHEPVQYVLDVLKDDGPIMACEPTATYKSSK